MGNKEYEFERRVKKMLTERGFLCVRYKSNDNFSGLLAISRFCWIYFVRCKFSKVLSEEEKQKLENFIDKFPSIDPVIAYNKNGEIAFCNLEYDEKRLVY